MDGSSAAVLLPFAPVDCGTLVQEPLASFCDRAEKDLRRWAWVDIGLEVFEPTFADSFIESLAGSDTCKIVW